jgi:hypothetical protein
VKRRLSATLYCETYPGIGLGLIGEWVAHHQHRGCGHLEIVLAVPFLTIRTELIVRMADRRTLR